MSAAALVSPPLPAALGPGADTKRLPLSLSRRRPPPPAGPALSLPLPPQQPGPADGDRILPAGERGREGGKRRGASSGRPCGDGLVLNPAPQYGIPFYLQYLAHWPEYFIVAEAPGGELMGYSECTGSPARCGHGWGTVTQELFFLFTLKRGDFD